MQSNLLSLWRIRAVAMLLALIGAVAFFILATSSAFAAAPNGFTSQTYKDNTGDGVVDAIDVVVNGGEVLTTCTVTDVEVGTDWIYVGNDIGGTLNNAGNVHTCNLETATVTLSVTGANANTTTHSTAPTIAYANAGTLHSIANATGSLSPAGPANLTDGAKPIFLTAATSDNNGDGSVDRLVMTFSESVVITDGGTDSDITLAASSGTATVTAGAYGATASSLTYTITTSVTSNTAITVSPTYATAGAGDITDAAGNEMLNGETFTGTDGAKPAILSAVTGDNNTDGTVDRLVLTFSESVTVTDGGTDNDITLVASSGTSTITAGTYGVTATTLTYTISASASDNTAITVTPTYATAGDGSIIDASANEMNNTETVAGTDGAGPALLSSTPDSGATNVSTTSTIVMTFSEPVITGSFTWAHLSGGPATTLFSSAWTVSDTVLTLTVAGTISSGYHRIDITAAPDAAANPFTGANPATTDPIIFTVRSTSAAASGSTSSGDTSYEIEVTSPNGGESYTAGDSIDITWSSSSTSAMSAVNINLSYTEDGSTYTETIAEGITNDGSYTWTVPNISTDAASIQVVGTDLVTSLATDTSDDVFSIGVTATDDESEDDEDVTAPSTGETGLSPVTGEEEDISEVADGDYIRSVYFDTVYYVEEGTSGLVRRPFMDAQTFMTWQVDFSNVVTVTDATLPTLSLGSPMLPKSGVVLVKVQSNAKVYVIDNDNELRWVSSEEVAIELFGNSWADYVIDVPATLFPRFEQGDDIDAATDFDADADAMKTRAEVNS